MNRKGSALLVALIVVVLLAIAGGVWYYKTHQQLSPTIPPNSVTASSTQTADTSGWPTYHNALYGYTISYPPDATIQYENYEQTGSSPAASSTEANEIVISINTSTYPDALANASVDILPSKFYVGATGVGIGDKIVSSTFTLNGSTYTANGIDGSADDGSMFMDAQVGNVEIGYRFSPTDLKAIGEPEFLEVQNELIAIIKTFDFDSGTVLDTSSSAIFITPTSGPAGAMIVLHGSFSVCGNETPSGDCTEDRFNQLVFLQNGNPVSSDVSSALGSDGNVAYQVPTSLTPGNYEFAIQNCLGKGCSNYPLGSFTVSAPNPSTKPTIDNISPTSTTNLTSPITLYGSGFTSTGNYIAITTTGSDGKPTLFYFREVSSMDGKTITFQFPACYAATPPCGSFAYGSAKFAVSNANGTSNFIPFGLLVQPYVFK